MATKSLWSLEICQKIPILEFFFQVLRGPHNSGQSWLYPKYNVQGSLVISKKVLIFKWIQIYFSVSWSIVQQLGIWSRTLGICKDILSNFVVFIKSHLFPSTDRKRLIHFFGIYDKHCLFFIFQESFQISCIFFD